MHESNTPDRPARIFFNDKDVLDLLRGPEAKEIASFEANNRSFKIIHVQSLKLNSNFDANDKDALRSGYAVLSTIVAVDCQDKLPYAIWEFYATADSSRLLSKAIDVDVNHQRQGIGYGFMHVMRKKGYTIQRSGFQTKAGAALLNRLDAQAKPDSPAANCFAILAVVWRLFRRWLPRRSA
ncbi:hypothetical protein [Methylobacterium fujisawaense]